LIAIQGTQLHLGDNPWKALQIQPGREMNMASGSHLVSEV
jgi:hypothetical protein